MFRVSEKKKLLANILEYWILKSPNITVGIKILCESALLYSEILEDPKT